MNYQLKKIHLVLIIPFIITACSTLKSSKSTVFNEADYDKVTHHVSAGPEYKLLKKGYNYGFYKEGEGIILPVEYFLMGIRSDGSVLFNLDEPFIARRKGKWGKVHMDGKIAVEFKYDYLFEAEQGNLYCQDKNKIGLLEDGTSTVITNAYKYLMGALSNEGKRILMVSNDGKTIEHIDASNGASVTVAKREKANSFMVVHANGNFGLYDIGEQVYIEEPIYELVKPSNGAYYFWKDGKETKVIGIQELWKE